MTTNRLPKDQQLPPADPSAELPDQVTKVVVVQTPMGVLQLTVPSTTTPDGKDPLTVAMEMFQTNVERGADDPLMETLIVLKHMADNNNAQPLLIGLAVLKQMADSGMLPPMPALIEGTGITQTYVEQALKDAGQTKRPGVLEKLDSIFLN